MAGMREKGIFTGGCFRAGKFMFSSTKTMPQAATRSHRKRLSPNFSPKTSSQL